MKAATFFCGAGGACVGLKQSGIEVIWGNEFNPLIADIWKANHPNAVLNGQDILDLPIEEIPEADLYWFSPPCFPAGTLVLTPSGLAPIQTLKIGDHVMTHKGRYRAITRVMKRQSETVVVKGLGHHGLTCTPDHPFLATNLDGTLAPNWTPAEDLKGKHWMHLTEYPPEKIPELTYGKKELRGCNFDTLNPSFWWVVGFWVGDGWVRFSDSDNTKRKRAEVLFGCGYKKAEKLTEHYHRMHKHRYQDRQTCGHNKPGIQRKICILYSEHQISCFCTVFLRQVQCRHRPLSFRCGNYSHARKLHHQFLRLQTQLSWRVFFGFLPLV